MSETFGQYIRSLRSERGLTQRALSKFVGFRSLAHLSDIESGKRYPARNTLPKFAEALGVTVGELESRDTRGFVEAAKVLFYKHPEMVAAFWKVLRVAETISAEELVKRVESGAEGMSLGASRNALNRKPAVSRASASGEPKKPELAEVETAPPVREFEKAADVLESIGPVLPTIQPVPLPTEDKPQVLDAAGATSAADEGSKRPHPATKRQSDQPTLF